MDGEYLYRISIIIPHFNTPELLENLLSTIPDSEEIQVIVVDDHSDDASAIRLLELKQSPARKNTVFLTNDLPEHDAGTARNIGLDHAKGEWLLFADSDDFFAFGFYDIISQYFDMDCDIVFFHPTTIRLDTGKPNRKNRHYVKYICDFLDDPCMETECCLRYSWYAPWSKMIRTSLVRSNKIRFSSVKFSNDAMFSVKTGLYAGKIAVSLETVYFVTEHAGSLTTDISLESFDTRAQESIRIYQFLRKNLSEKEMENTAICHFAFSQMLIILRRRYGIRCFFRYLKIFMKNRTLHFSFGMLNHVKMIRWLAKRINGKPDANDGKDIYEIRS